MNEESAREFEAMIASLLDMMGDNFLPVTIDCDYMDKDGCRHDVIGAHVYLIKNREARKAMFYGPEMGKSHFTPIVSIKTAERNVTGYWLSATRQRDFINLLGTVPENGMTNSVDLIVSMIIDKNRDKACKVLEGYLTKYKKEVLG